MINNTYAKAYTEVLEIINYFPKEDYLKIPPEKIEFYKNNMDKNYFFKINPDADLAKQNISKEANSILINLYKDYYATEKQNAKINNILDQNQKESEIVKREKYNPDDIFKNMNKIKPANEIVENNNLPIEIKKDNFFNKFIMYIKSLFMKIRK